MARKIKEIVPIVGLISSGPKNVRVLHSDGSESRIPTTKALESLPKVTKEGLAVARLMFIRNKMAALLAERDHLIEVLR